MPESTTSQERKLVYVVTSGDYSSEYIVGIFDSPEAAKAATACGYNDPQTYYLNPRQIHPQGVWPHMVLIDREGTIHPAEDLWVHCYHGAVGFLEARFGRDKSIPNYRPNSRKSSSAAWRRTPTTATRMCWP